MISSKMAELGKKRSVIREIFEYGNQRAAQIGRENVFDFSLGNPSVPAPEVVNETIIDLCQNTSSLQLHGYTSAQGDAKVRQSIADSIKSRFGYNADANKIYMTVGAAASLTITLKALICPENFDEVIVFAPFFPEYKVFIEAAGGKCVVIPAQTTDFQINFNELEKSINKNTKAVIINSPNNPSGVVYTKETISKLTEMLDQASKDNGSPIYLISDEPYREITYGMEIPYVPLAYNNTIVCYSYSKSLSLPGERIGYILVGNECEDSADLYAAVCGAGRALGYVCAPSMFQKVIGKCLNTPSNVSAYKENRDLLYNALTSFGYDCVKPDGAFYLFVRSPEEDANKFCMNARKYELLLVPSDDFGCTGFVRISYCVSNEMIKRSLPSFEKLINEYNK